MSRATRENAGGWEGEAPDSRIGSPIDEGIKEYIAHFISLQQVRSHRQPQPIHRALETGYGGGCDDVVGQTVPMSRHSPRKGVLAFRAKHSRLKDAKGVVKSGMFGEGYLKQLVNLRIHEPVEDLKCLDQMPLQTPAF